MIRILRSAASRFARDNNGSVTVEFVMWLPMFIAVFALVTDVAMIFNGHSRIMRVVQDANRNYSVDRLETTEEVQSYIENNLAALAPNATASSVEIAGVITTNVTVNASDLDMLGMFASLHDVEFTVTSQQFIEY